jgi:hypothetical protein
MLSPVVNHRPKGKVTQEHDDIIKMVATPGWQLMLESLSRNKAAAVELLCADKPMSEVELAYQRATIRAIDRMMRHPETILDALKTELAMMPSETEGSKSDGS